MLDRFLIFLRHLVGIRSVSANRVRITCFIISTHSIHLNDNYEAKECAAYEETGEGWARIESCVLPQVPLTE